MLLFVEYLGNYVNTIYVHWFKDTMFVVSRVSDIDRELLQRSVILYQMQIKSFYLRKKMNCCCFVCQ